MIVLKKKNSIWYFHSIAGHFISSVPSLDLPGVVIGRRRAGELDGLAVQRSVSEQVTEILKELQQLVRRVLKDSQHLRGHHVVDDKERRLRGEGDDGVGGNERQRREILGFEAFVKVKLSIRGLISYKYEAVRFSFGDMKTRGKKSEGLRVGVNKARIN